MNKFGSVWGKWDFHVHTPYSILNNNYGFNPFELTGEGELETKFDEYVQILFTKAIENNICAIGITDYFMADGYKRLKEHYLDNPTKMKELFPDSEMFSKIQKIYVFPNIELRIDSFVGEGAKSINYHVIFSNEISIHDIEENFLHQLKFMQTEQSQLSITRENIISYGKFLKQNKGENGSDLLIGLKHVAVNYTDILQVLNRNTVFSGKYIITIPVDEDLPRVGWSGRDYSTRLALYHQCHCYMTSNPRTIFWALAEGEEEERIREFGAIKPCIWGSDAHEYDRMFNQTNDRYCWIKAEPTFEGLLQILYEPKERVVIQKEYPDEKDVHQIIESIKFEDANFQTEPIVFNDYLTCIIGGKSTGKSLLLQQLARAIDTSYAEKQESVSAFGRKSFAVEKAIVTWKDGTSDKRKIVYIPQTYLNRTIDNPEKTTAINEIIEGVLQQEEEIEIAFSTLSDKLKRIKNNTQASISAYCEKSNELKELEETIKEEGMPESFSRIIEQLEQERTELAEKTNVRQEDVDRYALLEEMLKAFETKEKLYAQEIIRIDELQVPVVVVPKYFNSFDGVSISYTFQEEFPNTYEKLQRTVDTLSNLIRPDWEKVCGDLKIELSEKLVEVKKQKEEAKAEYESLKIKVEQSEQIQKLSVRISSERSKLQMAQTRQELKKKLEESLMELKKQIVSSQRCYLDAYAEYCDVVISTGTKKNTSLTFDAKAVWKQMDFQTSLGHIFNNRNYTAFNSMYKYDLSNLSPENYGEKLLNALWVAMSETDKTGALPIKTAYTMETALQQIFGDWYNIHYIVKSGQDTIEEMSPGKKALVLLELLISLENSKCPILIDQPEDDLDNRSIYEDLVKYIKEKKKERQIIVVTHNANVVLGADAEEVIIANQAGKDTENVERRFEYRSGAIENDIIELDVDGNPLPGILNKSGIQTQICDILEGGRPAFELRKNKYKTEM